SDQRQAAAGAVRGLTLRRNHVAGVHMAKAAVERELASPREGLRAGARSVSEEEVGVKRREVQRNVGTQLVEEPGRELPQLVDGAVQTRDQKRGGLEPGAAATRQMAQGVEDRPQLGSALLLVERLGERLEVHVDRVHGVEE